MHGILRVLIKSVGFIPPYFMQETLFREQATSFKARINKITLQMMDINFVIGYERCM